MSSLGTSKGNHLDLVPCNHTLEDQRLVSWGGCMSSLGTFKRNPLGLVPCNHKLKDQRLVGWGAACQV